MTKVAVVTGGSKGIGAAIARRLAGADYEVLITYLEDSNSAQQVTKSIEDAGGRCQAVQVDVRDEASVAALFDLVGRQFGHLDLLVNNAVREVSQPIDLATLEQWHTVLETKLDGAFLTTKAALHLFEKAEAPSMIALSTFEAHQPSPTFTAYGVANAGIDAFVKAMALFLPKYGARCNAVCPGPVPTPLWGPDEANEQLWSELAAANPTGRNATPDDVAEVVLLIGEEPTRMVNGSFIYVNGGNHLRQA